MKVLQEILPGCFLLEPTCFRDSRGKFVKTYHEGLYKTLGIHLEIREEFYSVSQKGVVRGMHFQSPPYEHDKLVYCIGGAVRDVLLDLRKGSGYGGIASVILSADNINLIYIPKGIAHGFVALTEGALMLYKTNSVHEPEGDKGILWNSFGFDWAVTNPIVSERDQKHKSFVDFKSPF